jgi:hypothetical protein
MKSKPEQEVTLKSGGKIGSATLGIGSGVTTGTRGSGSDDPPEQAATAITLNPRNSNFFIQVPIGSLVLFAG